MNAAQVRAKARMAMKRREEDIETEELEGGELNLVPYLDIVTNVMLFLLATISAGFILGNINSALPEYAASDQPGGPAPDPDKEPPIQLVVAVTKPEILVFSLSGAEGTLQAPKVKVPASKPGLEYDYARVSATCLEIVKRRWQAMPPLGVVGGKNKCVVGGKEVSVDKCRPEGSTEVILMADGEIPYSVVVATMDALRQAPDNTYLFPDILFSTGIQ